jgi:protein-disulfide isomerase
MTSPENVDSESPGKEPRERASSQGPAGAAVDTAARRKRLAQLGAVVVAVVVVVVIIVVATGGGGKSNIPATKAAQQSVASEVSSELAGIPQSGNTLGQPVAPVTLQYFGDLECPICRDFTLSSLPTLISKYVKTGKLKIQYRSLETATHEQSTFGIQQVAALAAGKQSRMWDYVELFYREQGEEDSGYVTEAYLQKLAEQVHGLDLGQWTSDRNDPALAAQVASDAQVAAQSGFNGTPSFLLGKSGGTLSPFAPASFTEPSSFESAIEKLLG